PPRTTRRTGSWHRASPRSRPDAARSRSMQRPPPGPHSGANRGRRRPSAAHHVQHLMAGAHGVIVGLAGRTLLVAVPAIVGVEDPVPGTVVVVDHVPPRPGPQALVPVPVLRIPGAMREQRGRGQGFGLDPEVLVVVADVGRALDPGVAAGGSAQALVRKAVDHAATQLVPGV